MEFTARQIADFLTGEIEGDPSVVVSDFSRIEDGKAGTLSFLSNPKYTHFLYDTQASIVLVSRDFVAEKKINSTLIRVSNPYESLAKLMNLVVRQKPRKTGISSLAFISLNAQIGDNALIEAFSCIGENVSIGSNVTIHPQVYIANNVTIGNDVTLFPGVVIHHNTIIGNRCIIHSNAVIGSDGFGFAPAADGTYEKIPQLGNVVLADDVEIGANSTIDRATFGSTQIAQGVKIDNLVQIAHNVEVGEHSVIASQTGIAGSSKIGKKVMFGGQVGITGHVSIADGTILGAKAGVAGSIKVPGQVWSGYPAVPMNTFRRSYVVNKNLPEMQKTVNELLGRIEKLEQLIQKKES